MRTSSALVAGLAYDEKTSALYYTSQQAPYGVFRWREGMTEPERVAECENTPLGIALDGSSLYWLTRDSYTAQLWRAAK